MATMPVSQMDNFLMQRPIAIRARFVSEDTRAQPFQVHIGKNQLKIFLRPIDYDDPRKRVDKIPDGYNWTMDRRVYLDSADDLITL